LRVALALLALLVAAPAAGAASLPTVSSGERPGPPLLYAKAPRVPQLEVRRPFRAGPLLISGTAAYRRGEYLYQDYLYDDHGASTRPGSPLPPGSASFSPTSGDVLYPTGARFANNAADLVELRIRPTRRAVVYRVTLNTALDEDTAAVAIGVDTDRRGGAPVAWPRGARISSPGVDRFIVAWGSGGEVGSPGGAGAALPGGAVRMDLRRNQMTIRVPRRLMDPGRRTWRYVAGVGLWSGSGFMAVDAGAPAIFNLAFRFEEPQPRGSGSWFEEGQATALANRTSGAFRADVDFAHLARGRGGWAHAPGRKQARIYPSRLRLHEGVRSSFPEFGGRLQPYLVYVPRLYRRLGRVGLTFALHSLSATYTQYAVYSPNQPQQLGDELGFLYVTPLGRGPDGWYSDEAEVDFFEVWADVARRFRLRPNRVALSGYSMGGYGTYKLGMQWPDLFGAAFTAVAPPARGIWLPPGPPAGGEATNTNQLVENARWLPYVNWAGRTDSLVPIAGPRSQQARFDQLGLRSQLWTFPGGHLDPAARDEWEAAQAFLVGSVVQRDPRRVDYAFVLDADRRRLGLVHDHAYWVSNLRVRDRRGDPRTDPARSEISARSGAPTPRFGRAGEPRTVRVTGPGDREPAPESVTGTEWDGIARGPHGNLLTLRLENVRSARLDGRRAGLSGRRCLRVTVASDGPARVRLALGFQAGAGGRRGRDCGGRRAREVEVGRRGATLRVGAGRSRFAIRP
jgi:Putative esterase